MTDDCVAIIAKLSTLRSLHIEETPLADIGVEHLSRLKLLDSLSINCSKLTRSGLKPLRQLQHLRELRLRNTTDSQLAGLPELRELRCLVIEKPQVLDASIAVIAKLPSLKELWLPSSGSGEQRLEELRPTLQIKWGLPVSYYDDLHPR